jgi:2-methylcitrate dehydratase PrpD
MEAYSRILAEFVSDFDASDIPDEVFVRSRQSILNATAAALSASRAAPVDILLSVYGKDEKSGNAQLFGRPETLNLLNAVLINAFMAHYDDYDDTHRGAGYHTNPSTVPVLLGLGGDRHVNGREALTSLALGLEASIRLGVALGGTHSNIGWHTTGTMGTVGTALMSSRLLKLDAQRTNYALGLSLTQAAGLRGQMFGTMAKPFNAAKAAQNGLAAALLAEGSFTAAENSIEGGRAYGTAASRNADLTRITDGLGSRWETVDIGFKPYASGAATHATVDAVLALRSELGLDEKSSADQIAHTVREIGSLKITAHEGALTLPRQREISNPFDAKFSIYNVAAIVLTRGRGGPGEYNEAVMTDPSIAYLRELIELVGDPDTPNGSAALVAELHDGRRINIEIDGALGTIRRPLDDVALRAKLFDAASVALDRDSIDRLASAIEHIEQAQDVGTILQMTIPG